MVSGRTKVPGRTEDGDGGWVSRLSSTPELCLFGSLGREGETLDCRHRVNFGCQVSTRTITECVFFEVREIPRNFF